MGGVGFITERFDDNYEFMTMMMTMMMTMTTTTMMMMMRMMMMLTTMRMRRMMRRVSGIRRSPPSGASELSEEVLAREGCQ